MTSLTQKNRTPLSLRLPANELSAINTYAKEQQVSKTDAFLHFLRRGIEAENRVDPQIKDLQVKLDTVLLLLERSPAVLTKEDIARVVTNLATPLPAIKRVYLFGSFARGDATASSDVDLRIELEDDESFSLFDLSRFKKDLERTLGRSSDIITAHKLDDEKLAQEIEREKVLIYERKEL